MGASEVGSCPWSGRVLAILESCVISGVDDLSH